MGFTRPAINGFYLLAMDELRDLPYNSTVCSLKT